MNKDFIFLILLLVIVFGVLFWQNPETVNFYFDRMKAVIAPELELSQDSGLDLSEINIENLFEQDEKKEESVLVLEGVTLDKEEEDGIGGPLVGELLWEEEQEKGVVLEKKLSLEEIEQEISRVAEEVERIDKEVQTLVALNKTQ